MKKTWTPVLLCIVFMVAWQFLVVAPYQRKHAPTPPVASSSSTGTTNVAAPPSGLSPARGGSAATAPTPQSLADTTVFEKLALSPQRSVEIFSRGSLGTAEFRDYKVREKKEAQTIVVLPRGFHWQSTDPKVSECLGGVVGRKSGEDLVFSAKTASGTCEISYRKDPNREGLLAGTLTLSGFAGAQGVVELKAVGDIGEGPALDQNNLVLRVDGSKESLPEKKLYETKRFEGKIDWMLWGDRYFATALLPKGNYNPNVVVGAVDQAKKQVFFGFQYPLFSKAEPTKYEIDIYFGTRDVESLDQIHPTLRAAVDLGIFASVARIMLWALKHLNTVFGNFGVSIIVLTIAVRLAFFPLNRKVYASAQKMKSLQPQIDKIKAKYGSDKSKAQAMNLELMAFYKTNNVNPMGSCLPLLLQMPIFLGLYGALNHSIDLYQAPFFGWIVDLSSKDPYYVLPVLWTVTLLAYVKLNPQSSSPQPGMPDMKWMMMGMNVFFGYFSRSWPAGLTLYLFVSNLVGITQQFLMQRATKLQPVQEGA